MWTDLTWVVGQEIWLLLLGLLTLEMLPPSLGMSRKMQSFQLIVLRFSFLPDNLALFILFKISNFCEVIKIRLKVRAVDALQNIESILCLCINILSRIDIIMRTSLKTKSSNIGLRCLLQRTYIN